jgi:hypothetical protein
MSQVHYCHARPLCKVPVPPAMLFCRPHWAMVPPDMKRRHWAVYKKRYDGKPQYFAFLDSLGACVSYVKTIIEERAK